MKNLFILTGAGISAESGLKTFRGSDGLWEGHAVEDVATPEAFEAHPKRVQRFYNLRRAQLNEVEPNEGHIALARLEKEWAGDFLICTQNVDDLHERAGSKKVHHMHGELRKARCTSCRAVSSWQEDILHQQSPCPSCQAPTLRPHIVWFGEVPFDLDGLSDFLSRTEIFISIGTSGVVYPAAAFVQMLPPACRTIEVNLEPSAISSYFDETHQGRSSEILPKLVESLLGDL